MNWYLFMCFVNIFDIKKSFFQYSPHYNHTEHFRMRKEKVNYAKVYSIGDIKKINAIEKYA